MNTSGESLISSKLLWLSTEMFAKSLGGADDAFIAAYPEVNTMRVSDLLEAIRAKHGRRRKSRNDMIPEQRYSPEPTTSITTSTSESVIV
jgi:hypothetical protein